MGKVEGHFCEDCPDYEKCYFAGDAHFCVDCPNVNCKKYTSCEMCRQGYYIACDEWYEENGDEN